MKKAKLILALAAMLSVSIAHAASLLDATAVTAYQTDFSDTLDALKLWIMGAVFVMGGTMFAINITKKGLGKVSAR